MKVRVGIVGVGHRGIQIARSAAALDDVTVAALWRTWTRTAWA